MDISVIFATYNRPKMLEETLDRFLSLKTENLTWEIVLVDNAGDPETERVAKKFAELLPIHFLTVTQRGKNNALNRAVTEARGDLFVFTDDDVVVEPDWLIEMWEGAKRWPKHHVFGGRILPKYPAGHVPSLDHPFFLGAYAISDWGIPEGIYEAHRVWGPNMAIREGIFKEGWKFNADISIDGSMGSETELTNRLEKAGIPAVYLPKSLVHHQIRKEQLELVWLYDRAFRFGQHYAQIENKSNISKVIGIPPRLIITIMKAYIRIALSLFSKDKKNKFDCWIFLWETRGRIRWYRKYYHR